MPEFRGMKDFGTAIILAGGKSSRMGFDKQFLKIDEKSLIDLSISKLKEEFEEIIIVTNKPEEYKDLDEKVITDIIVGKGPLSGIHAGLTASSSKYSFVMACDMPNISVDYIRYMKSLISDRDIDGCATVVGDRVESLSSFYNKRIVEDIETHLKLGKRSMHYLLENLDIDYIEEARARSFDPQLKMFINLNTQEDLNNYIKR